MLVMPRLSIIAAISNNGCIGVDGKLPWRLKTDMRIFRRYTMGYPIIMGRKTYDSIPVPLQGRQSIVLTKNTLARDTEGVSYHQDALEAIRAADVYCNERGKHEAFVIGGAQVYDLFIGSANRLYLTYVHADIEGDTFFPKFDVNDYTLQQHTFYHKSDEDDHDFSMCIYDKKAE